MVRVAHRLPLLVACALALTAFAQPASAATPPDQQFAVGGPAMQAAEGIARAYWGGADACGGQVDVQWTDLDTNTNAVSTWSNPSSAYDDPGHNFDCHVSFNRLLAFDWPRFCTVLVHEFGHLTGHPHSDDPNDVMTAIYNGPVSVCSSAADPTAVPAVAPAPVAAPAPTANAASKTVTRSAKPRVRRTRELRHPRPHPRKHRHHHHFHRSHH